MIIKVYNSPSKEPFTKAADYFKKRGYSFEFSFETLKLKGTVVETGYNATKDGKTYRLCGVNFPVPAPAIVCFSGKEYKDILATSTTNGLVISLNTDTDMFKALIHELMHVLFNKVQKQKEDPMDAMVVNGKTEYYYKNDNPEAPDGNFAEGFKRLEPFKAELTGVKTEVKQESKLPPIVLAIQDLGIKEVRGGENPKIVQYSKDVGHSWVKEDEVAWCAAFVGSCLERAGIRSTRLLNARSYLNWNQPTSTPKTGDIAVFSRGSNPAEGHVAFFLRDEGDKVIVLGGNQSDSVSVQGYPRSSLLGFRSV